MEHNRHPKPKDYKRPFRPNNIHAFKGVPHYKKSPHQTQEKQKGFQEVQGVDFFAALQEVHDSVKRKGSHYSKSN